MRDDSTSPPHTSTPTGADEALLIQSIAQQVATRHDGSRARSQRHGDP